MIIEVSFFYILNGFLKLLVLNRLKIPIRIITIVSAEIEKVIVKDKHNMFREGKSSN